MKKIRRDSVYRKNEYYIKKSIFKSLKNFSVQYFNNKIDKMSDRLAGGTMNYIFGLV